MIWIAVYLFLGGHYKQSLGSQHINLEIIKKSDNKEGSSNNLGNEKTHLFRWLNEASVTWAPMCKNVKCGDKDYAWLQSSIFQLSLKWLYNESIADGNFGHEEDKTE